MKLMTNAVYKRDGSLWRLIRTNDGNCLMYPLGSRGTKYRTVPAAQLLRDIETTTVESDPYASLQAGEASNKANASWELIKDLVANEEVLFNPKSRAAKINEICKRRKLYPLKLYRLLALWWERGQYVAALNRLPQEKPRSSGTGAKPGRRSAQSANPKVDEAMKVEFEKAFHKYILKEDLCSMQQGYRYFLGDYKAPIRK